MKTFVKFDEGYKFSLSNETGKTILEMFGRLSASYIYEKKDARRPNTNAIKYSLVNLGHELGYSVYANGLNPEQRKEQWEKYKFVCREFLYDVHWYKDLSGKFYTPESIRLVVESELGDIRKG